MTQEDIVRQRKQLTLNASFTLLQNLCKSPENSGYFKDPEVNALKWLDVYKGSPSKERRMSSLLILSYIIDPDTQTGLIEDTEGVLDILIVKLDEQMNGKSNEFSIHELVEGLGKLAVNPVNKAKIKESSLENIQTVLLTGSEKEKKLSEIALMNIGFDPKDILQDVVSTSPDTDICGKVQETDQTTAAIEFTRNMLCVLEQTEDYSNDECSEVITAIYDGACKDLTREEREVVAEQLVANDIAGLLMKIAVDLSKDIKSLYEDGNIFTTFFHVLNLIAYYSDASLLFCDAMGMAGAVKFLFGVCEKYYNERREKFANLLEMHEARNLTPGVQQDKPEVASPDKLEENCSTSTKSEQNDPEEPPADDKGYFFQPAQSSEVMKIINRGRTVQNLNTTGELHKPVVVSTNRQLETGILFEIQVDQLMDKNFPASSEIGVSTHSQIPDNTVNIGDGILGKCTGFWLLRSTDLMKDFHLIGGGYKLNLREVKVGDKIGIARFPDSTIHYFLNGEDMGAAFYDVPQDIYMLLCVAGCWEKVTLQEDINKITISAKRCEESTSLHEAIELTTLGGEQIHGTKVKHPYNLHAIDKESNPSGYKQVEKAVSRVKKEKASVIDDYLTQKEGAERLKTIAAKYNEKGYLNEQDMEFYMTAIQNISKIGMDRITNVPYVILNKLLELVTFVILNLLRPDLDRGVLNMGQEHTVLTGRFADLFEVVVKPCFDNLKNLSQYVWAGSTSEGFAFIDENHDGVYINDEMDIMVPIATVTEERDGQPGYKVPSCVVSELESISIDMAKETPLIWSAHKHPGYVRVQVSEVGLHYLSQKFLHDVCIEAEKDGRQVYQLSRAKILKSQGDYVRERFPKVQEKLEEKSKEGTSLGKLQLEQEGPAQTLSIQIPIRQEPSGAEFMYEQVVDVTLALKCREWPSLAQSWITRERSWPDEQIVKKIVNEGCHIVPKAYPGQDGDMELDWRLSFSQAERTLALSINEHQRACFLVLKAFWRKFFKEPRALSSYHLKTTFFWRCEKIPKNLWNETTTGERFLELVDDLIVSLQKRNVPNFFIPENNMLSHVADEDIKQVLAKVLDIRNNILMYVNIYNNSFGNKFQFSQKMK